VSFGQAVQLQHVKSGRFLTVCSKEVADLESSCQKVVLRPLGSQESWWILRPRYKLGTTQVSVRYVESVTCPSRSAHPARWEAALVSGQRRPRRPTRDAPLSPRGG